ncbi:MAG: TIGR03936 family radical SAM-associated protein [Firmicutes bacterium]|nr:TIGR03936 family radical SAM-associated protein [Bacillota bacterium]
MNYRINYEVKGSLAFLSHLEVMRLWQRAMLRGHLPIAWTQGFNPRPKLSLGPARNVGVEGLSEYLDAEFNGIVKSNELMEKLNGILPEGVTVLKVREIPQGTKMLEAVINEAVYKVTFLNGMPADAAEKVADLMAAETCLYVRKSPKGEKEIDLRSFIMGMEIEGDNLMLSVKTGTGGSLRVAELLAVLGYLDILKDIKIQRLGLFVTDGAKRFTP